MKIIYNRWIPFKGFSAVNMAGTVFARREYSPLSRRTLNHEAIHTAQMKELGYLPFYLLYFVEWIIRLFIHGKQAYRNISFEREAYDNMDGYEYLKVRRHYAFLKYLRGKTK